MTWWPVEFEGIVGTTPVLGRVATAEGGDASVLLVRDATGRLHATEPRCPHLGHPLRVATVEGRIIECAGHAFRYRLTDGSCEGPGGPLAGRLLVHRVRERDGRIEVALHPDARVADPPQDAGTTS